MPGSFIPAPLYRKILSVMPIVCVDAVVVCRGQFLLGRRKNKPAKNFWWLVGGRVAKGETLKDAIYRHVKTETGARKIAVKKFLTVKETMFKDSAWGSSTHSVNSIFLVRVPQKKLLPANGENAELKWFSRIDASWHPYVKDALHLAGFK